MDSGTALRETVGRLREPAVLALLAGFTLVGLGTTVAQQTLLSASLEQFLAVGGDPSTLPASPADLRPIPLALPVGYGAALLLVGGLALVAEFLHVVALRVFADWGSLSAAARRGIGAAVVAGFLVGVVVKAFVLAGLLAFVLPGAFLATALLFAHARVAVAGDGVLAALRESWALTAGNRLRVFGVVFALLGFFLLPRALGGLVPDEPVGLLVSGVLLGPANLLATGLVARAYVALEAEAAAEPESEGEGEDEEDPWNQPLGPDDLPEP